MVTVAVRDLPLTAAVRKRPYVHLEGPGLIRCVSEPPPVWRESGHPLVEWRLQEHFWFPGPQTGRIALHRHRPDVRTGCGVDVRKRQPFAICRKGPRELHRLAAGKWLWCAGTVSAYPEHTFGRPEHDV